MSAPDTPAPKSPGHAEEVGEGRQERGSQQGSARDRPHVTRNDVEAGQIKPEGSGGQPVPAMPANASGTDRVTTDEQDQGIDPESMYDRRPAEHKDRPASEEG